MTIGVENEELRIEKLELSVDSLELSVDSGMVVSQASKMIDQIFSGNLGLAQTFCLHNLHKSVLENSKL
jgi:hypothetical protein